MKVNRKKLELSMARACMTAAELPEAAQLPRPTVYNAICGRNIRPATVGKIARALNCDPTDILEEV